MPSQQSSQYIQQQNYHPSSSSHHQAIKNSCPVTLYNSNQVSFDQAPNRKYSMASLSNQHIDIDKVMIDIKLTPLKSNQLQEKIKTIYYCLEYLKKTTPCLLEEVRTAELVIQSIEHKLLRQNNKETKRIISGNETFLEKGIKQNRSQAKQLSNSNFNTKNMNRSSSMGSNMKKNHLRHDSSSHKEPQSYKKSSSHSHLHEQNALLSKRKTNPSILATPLDNQLLLNQVSPIKQLQEMTSRIVYANFSIKDLESGCRGNRENSKERSERRHISSVKKELFPSSTVSLQQNENMKSLLNEHILNKQRVQSQLRCVNSNPLMSSVSKSSNKIAKKQLAVFTVSKFDPQDQQMQRLAKNIQALDKVLQQKGCLVGIRNSSNKQALKQSIITSSNQQFQFQKRNNKGGIPNSNRKSNHNTIQQRQSEKKGPTFLTTTVNMMKSMSKNDVRVNSSHKDSRGVKNKQNYY